MEELPQLPKPIHGLHSDGLLSRSARVTFDLANFRM